MINKSGIRNFSEFTLVMCELVKCYYCRLILTKVKSTNSWCLFWINDSWTMNFSLIFQVSWIGWIPAIFWFLIFCLKWSFWTEVIIRAIPGVFPEWKNIRKFDLNLIFMGFSTRSWIKKSPVSYLGCILGHFHLDKNSWNPS